MSRLFAAFTVACTAVPLLAIPASAAELFERVEHHVVSNDGVDIHYVAIGEGEVLLFVHGFPHFWYVWNHQMEGLSDSYRCVAMDTRGANKSARPEGVEKYSLEHLMGDIDAVITELAVDKVTLVAHDWGGIVSWYYTMDERYRSKVNRLVMMSLTHPMSFSRALAEGTDQQRQNVQYAKQFQTPGSGAMIEGFAQQIVQRYADQGEQVVEFVRQGYERSDFEALLNYYRANYDAYWGLGAKELPTIQVPVLQFHGLKDRPIDKDGLKGTWDHIVADYTLVTYPDVGHGIQQEAPERVTTTMRGWLAAH
jgi:pimeloyl-ACP methyl ester carboxylesterase